MNNPTILIVDDEMQIRNLLRITLENNEYKVIIAENGKQGLLLAANHLPDLIILDLGLPDESGLIVLEKLREWYKNPVIILTVQSDETSIIRALDNGANDYITKPFRSGELLARIRAVMRINSAEEGRSVLTFDDLEIDFTSRMVKKNNEPVKLTSTEFALLSLFARNEGKVLTHDFLLKNVWGPGYHEQSQYLRVYVAALRKKIESDPNKPKFILTESGVGYRFMIGK